MSTNNRSSLSGTPDPPFLLSVVRWMARIASLGLLAFLALFIFGGRETGIPTGTQVISFFLFPIGLTAGTLWAWRDEVRGGGVALVSLAAFHLWAAVVHGRLWQGPFVLILGLPALVLLLCGIAERRARP